MIVRQGMALTLTGIAVGAVAAWVLNGFRDFAA
jgi:hypothetical protein